MMEGHLDSVGQQRGILCDEVCRQFCVTYCRDKARCPHSHQTTLDAGCDGALDGGFPVDGWVG